jgi:alkylation response protein AidB-like acyl-CoA dehydrogenase
MYKAFNSASSHKFNSLYYNTTHKMFILSNTVLTSAHSAHLLWRLNWKYKSLNAKIASQTKENIVNYFSDEPEWKWLFDNGINWDEIIPLYQKEYPTADGLNSQQEVLDFYKELLSATGAWANDSIAPRAQRLDIEGAGKVVDGRTIPGAALSEFYKESKELETFGICLPEEYEGLGLPALMQILVFAQISRSCMASSVQTAFYTSIGDMICRFCDEETKKKYVPMISRGEISGAMCLTEPGAGSDLSNLQTTATPQEDGKYLLNGSKFFITNGGGGLQFVLARVKGAPAGLGSISMFFVEQDYEGKEGPNYQVVKNEEKMGMHGSFTCEILYENTIATIVGEENLGFKYMLHLMNEARICTAAQALGGIEGCLHYANQYAQERQQFGKPIAELPLMKRNLHDFNTERDAIRALIVDSMSHFELYQKLDHVKRDKGELNEKETELLNESTRWTRKRTPLVKYYACESLTLLSQRSMQVLGGYGYMQEYPVERMHRDSFGPLLYEGTSQIQALMAMKDIVKYAMKDPKGFFSTILFNHPVGKMTSETWSKDFGKTQYKFKKKLIGLFLSCLRPNSGSIMSPKAWQKTENVEELMTHAETLCQALSYIETLRVLCEHCAKDQARLTLFNDYHKLIRPRLEAIYTDWSIRA